jgi:MFS family permease
VGLYYLKDDFVMSLISTAAFVSCAIFTIVGGLLFDKFSWKKLNVIFILIEAFFCVMMPFTFTSSYLYGMFLSVALAISGVSYMSVWLLSEKIYKTDTWVITVIALTLIIDMSLVNLFQAYVVPVRDK